MMTSKNKPRRSFAKDLETLKGLNFRQKLRFCLDYYKGYLFLLTALLLLAFYVGDMIYQARQTIELQGFFVNDNDNLFPAKALTREFSEYLDLPTGHRVAFEDSLFVDLNSSSEYTAASQGKIVAYTAAKELDFIVAPRELTEFYAHSFVLCDLEDLLPADMTAALGEDLYHAPDGTGEEKACALNLQNSRFLKTSGAPPDSPYFLMVLGYSPRREAMISFLKYAYE